MTASIRNSTYIKNIVRLGRPKFLFYSGLMQSIGAAAVYNVAGVYSLSRFAVGVGLGWVLHVATHYVNEYFDFEADKINDNYTSWTGGSRVLVDGGVAQSVAITLGILLSIFFLGSIGILMLFAADVLGPQPHRLAAAGAIALVFSWMYSAPPIRLIKRGLGEATVATVLCLMLPAGAAILQIGYVPALVWMLAPPLFMIQFARMLVMNIPDAASDFRAGKLTLVVRIGRTNAARLHNALQLAAYVTLILLWVAGYYPPIAALLLLATAPLAFDQARRMARGDAENPLAFQALASNALRHVVASAVAILVGLVLHGLFWPLLSSGTLV